MRELRVVAFGSRFVGSMEYKGNSDPHVIRMFQEIGLVDAVGSPVRGNFILRYRPKNPNGKERDTPYELVSSEGGNERILERGAITTLDKHDHDPNIICCFADGKRSLVWLFACDTRPHLDCKLGRVSLDPPHPLIVVGDVPIYVREGISLIQSSVPPRESVFPVESTKPRWGRQAENRSDTEGPEPAVIETRLPPDPPPQPKPAVPKAPAIPPRAPAPVVPKAEAPKPPTPQPRPDLVPTPVRPSGNGTKEARPKPGAEEPIGLVALVESRLIALERAFREFKKMKPLEWQEWAKAKGYGHGFQSSEMERLDDCSILLFDLRESMRRAQT